MREGRNRKMLPAESGPRFPERAKSSEPMQLLFPAGALQSPAKIDALIAAP
jgi:hypothetical protein